MRILTKQEAIDSGMTASQIRTVARSLQRIARHGYESVEVIEDDGTVSTTGQIKSFSRPRDIHQNVRDLFKLARKM